ncbi:50S ribosome-binding GTPase [Methylicorpusculum oleiharenae]|uniref:GTPase family protein n=1 Tax=Methylicorpusculum oleiharenae TaxID=1338687 RepID=UPI001358E492|nr:GTPase [Methylicorpusculum oleiharenae]MCD2453113.1 50S ribosome-binding GTPase [Methylicorpusculum oleiharenae]
MKTRLNWLNKVLNLFLALPLLLLSGLGIYGLWQTGHEKGFLIVFAVFYAFVGLLKILVKKKTISSPDYPSVTANEDWPPETTEIWERINALAETLNPADYPLTDSQRLMELAKKVTGEVAGYYSSNKDKTGLDVPLRNILYITEKVSRDMRCLLDDKIPFSHLLTVNNGLQIWKWKARLESGHILFRMGSLLFSPVSSLPRELKQFFIGGKAAAYPIGSFERWLLQTLVKTIAYYAIELYGGQSVPLRITETEQEPELIASTLSKKPLRVLIAGQLKSGKSSLVNALSAELTAPVDVLPLTGALTPYKLNHDEIGDLLIFDSPGYENENAWYEPKLDQNLGGFDLILVVCAANQAARAADVKFMSALRTWFDQHLKRRFPPVLAIVSHIDQLRPTREWDPPYDIISPQNAKSQAIREALDYISSTLDIPVNDCIPVSLKQKHEYNIDALWSALIEKTPAMLRAQHLRSLAEGKQREKWALIRKQLAHAGRFAVNQIKKS